MYCISTLMRFKQKTQHVFWGIKKELDIKWLKEKASQYRCL